MLARHTLNFEGLVMDRQILDDMATPRTNDLLTYYAERLMESDLIEHFIERNGTAEF